MASDTQIGPITRRVLRGLKKEMTRRIIDFDALKTGAEQAEELCESVISEKKMAGMDPLHAVYVYAQNMMSVLCEQVLGHPACKPLADAYEKAEEEYQPSGPPMSPLTTSFFTSWALLDLSVGEGRETPASIAMHAAKMIGVEPNLMYLFEHMRDSRMGVYVHEGSVGGRVILREFVTERRHQCLSSAGYMGKPGELWYLRIMPDPFEKASMGYDVGFTTPYVLLTMRDGTFNPASEKDWQSYFDRTLPRIGIQNRVQAYHHLMKYGLSCHYWNEFVFEGYVNHKREMIWLAGLPDDEASRPHSGTNRTLRQGAQKPRVNTLFKTHHCRMERGA